MSRAPLWWRSVAIFTAAGLLAVGCTDESASSGGGPRGELAEPRYESKKQYVRSDLVATSAFPFDDVSMEAGVYEKPTRSWGSAWTDYDGDGDADLFVGRHGARPHLYRNRGETFEVLDLPEDFYPEVIDRHGCAWGEANADGRPDLYCTQGVLRVSQREGLGRKKEDAATPPDEGVGPKQLLIQTPEGFRDAAEDYGVEDPYGRGRTVNWLDYDSDGDLDIFIGNKGVEAPPSALFRNDGDGFTRVDAGLEGPHSVISSSWADWDLDGDPDLLLVQYGPNPTVAYENLGGRFVAVNLPSVTGRVWSSGAWSDYDNDGRPDLHLVGRRRSVVVHNTRGGFVVEYSGRVTEGRTSTWLDVENDGDLDAFVVQGSSGEDPVPDRANEPDFLLVRKGGRFVKLGERSLLGPTVGNGDSVSAADFDRDGRTDLFTTNAFAHFKGPKILYRNLTPPAEWVGIDLDGDESNPLGIGAEVIVRTETKTLHRQVTDGFAFRQQNEVGYMSIGLGEADSARVRVRWPYGRPDCMNVRSGSVVRLSRGDSPCGDD
jgi:hypothetical protein